MAKELTLERMQTEFVEVLKEQGYEVKSGNSWSGTVIAYKIDKGAYHTWVEVLDSNKGLYVTHEHNTRRRKHIPGIIDVINEGYRTATAKKKQEMEKANQVKNATGVAKGFGLNDGEYTVTSYKAFVAVKTTINNMLNNAGESISYSSKNTVTINFHKNGNVAFLLNFESDVFTVENVEKFNKAKERITTIWAVATL